MISGLLRLTGNARKDRGLKNVRPITKDEVEEMSKRRDEIYEKI